MSELEVAVKAARAAAEVLMDTMGADLGISYKDARANLVTVADKQSQQVITEIIAGVFPDHIAVIHGTQRFTYAQFYRRCRRLAVTPDRGIAVPPAQDRRAHLVRLVRWKSAIGSNPRPA